MRKIPQFEDSENILTENLGQFIESRGSSIYSLPPVDGIVLSTAQSLPGCCVAGGAALALFTGEINRIKDWDLFFTSEPAVEEARRIFEGRQFKEAGTSPFCKIYTKHPVIVQLVTRSYYPTIGHIFADFDFSVCCVAVSGQDICYTRTSKKHIKDRKYDLIRAEDAALCLKRIARYGEKGFFPSDDFAEDFVYAVRNGLPLRREFY